MLDIGWTEIVVIAVVALVVLGPKELPRALRTVGSVMAKARAMAREFQSGVDQMIRETELDELRKELQKATELDFDDDAGRKIDPTSGRPAASAAGKADLPAPPAAPLPAPAAAATPTPATAAPTPAAAPPAIVATPPLAAGTAGGATTVVARHQAVAAVVANEEMPPFSALEFDRDYPRATELQAGSEFVPPEAEELAQQPLPGAPVSARPLLPDGPLPDELPPEDLDDGSSRPVAEDEPSGRVPVRAAE